MFVTQYYVVSWLPGQQQYLYINNVCAFEVVYAVFSMELCEESCLWACEWFIEFQPIIIYTIKLKVEPGCVL